MKISVVIPVYNGADILGSTIESVLAQTLPVHEIIVVSDSSTDDSVAVARSYGVRVIEQPKSGVCAARNAGILAATGDWIALLDHDDFWLPVKLERQAAVASEDAKLVFADFVRRRNGAIQPVSMLDDPAYRFESLTRRALTEHASVCTSAGEEILDVGYFLFPSGVLVERELMVSVGMFRENLRLCEDLECFLRVLAKTSLVVVKEPLWIWREHTRNNSRDWVGISEGWLSMGGFVEADPALYPPGTGRRLASRLRQARRELISTYTNGDDFTSARRVARTIPGERPTLYDRLFMLLTSLPPFVWLSLRMMSRLFHRVRAVS